MTHGKRIIAALLAGTLFGFGLSVAQMIDPAKVINFLDITGQWDPSLAFVMAGGLLINMIATPLILKRNKPLLAEYFQLPTRQQVDKRIVMGGAIFGIGWGLAGYCPGPMLTSLSFADSDILTVVAAFVVGTFATRWHLAHRPTHGQDRQ
ncbi:YeeE/YedE family protein [Marinobacterium weihaiense]|uniref:YeeE/YedE family protein n=1 Tax=Marinobacterium weihaiense TaxID=2851016 RepID=A0ABS6M7D1_9GAMM|nr:YeeE/YedE family protein [Marinobacterium weihaiense]MBV0931796.1 YeeE/YedE family protein [Marinobacterium weihaiense]